MVAPEPGEPLLLYIAATSEAMSMVLVAKWPDPHGLHELGSSSADGLGSQDPGPVEEPGANPAAGSQSPKAVTGPPDQTVVGSRTSSSRQAQRARTVQRPVYYISEVLHEAKMRYLEVHKLLYAVLITSKKQYAYINEVYKFLIKNMEKILHLCPWNK
jgi:hypothetical protein